MIEIDVRLTRGAFHLEAAFSAGSGVTALFGPSGSGKTTVIGLLAGLVRPDAGTVRVDGQTLTDTGRGVFVPAHRRRVGLVFQDARLFPHLTVRQNLLYGRWFAPREARRPDLATVARTLGIDGLLDRRPRSLSGGEQQRVAFGRALLSSPRLLLMDEPLAALDVARKLDVLPLIERMRDAFAIPIVYVSHSVDEVARLAEQVVVLDAGRVVAVGPPGSVLRSVPEIDRFTVASVLTGTAGPPDPVYGLTAVEHPAGTIWLTGAAGPAGSPVRVVVRGTDVALAVSEPAGLSVQTMLAGTVTAVRPGPAAHALVDVALPGGDRLTAVVTRRAVDTLGLVEGRAVRALIKAAAIGERTGRQS
jgi:molybdate transport system ATP-binding protein